MASFAWTAYHPRENLQQRAPAGARMPNNAGADVTEMQPFDDPFEGWIRALVTRGYTVAGLDDNNGLNDHIRWLDPCGRQPRTGDQTWVCEVGSGAIYEQFRSDTGLCRMKAADIRQGLARFLHPMCLDPPVRRLIRLEVGADSGVAVSRRRKRTYLTFLRRERYLEILRSDPSPSVAAGTVATEQQGSAGRVPGRVDLYGETTTPRLLGKRHRAELHPAADCILFEGADLAPRHAVGDISDEPEAYPMPFGGDPRDSASDANTPHAADPDDEDGDMDREDGDAPARTHKVRRVDGAPTAMSDRRSRGSATSTDARSCGAFVDTDDGQRATALAYYLSSARSRAVAAEATNDSQSGANPSTRSPPPSTEEAAPVSIPVADAAAERGSFGTADSAPPANDVRYAAVTVNDDISGSSPNRDGRADSDEEDAESCTSFPLDYVRTWLDEVVARRLVRTDHEGHCVQPKELFKRFAGWYRSVARGPPKTRPLRKDVIARLVEAVFDAEPATVDPRTHRLGFRGWLWTEPESLDPVPAGIRGSSPPAFSEASAPVALGDDKVLHIFVTFFRRHGLDTRPNGFTHAWPFRVGEEVCAVVALPLFLHVLRDPAMYQADCALYGVSRASMRRSLRLVDMVQTGAVGRRDFVAWAATLPVIDDPASGGLFRRPESWLCIRASALSALMSREAEMASPLGVPASRAPHRPSPPPWVRRGTDPKYGSSPRDAKLVWGAEVPAEMLGEPLRSLYLALRPDDGSPEARLMREDRRYRCHVASGWRLDPLTPLRDGDGTLCDRLV